MRKSKKELEADFRKKMIMDAAWRVFEEKGFPNTTMNDISEKSEYSLGTIYKLFAGKEDIYVQIFKSKFNDMMIEMDIICSSSKDTLSKLRDYLMTTFQFFEKNKKMLTIFDIPKWSIDLGFASRIQKKLEDDFNKLSEYFLNVLQKGMEEGIFRRVKISYARLALKGITTEIIWERMLYNHEEDLSETVDQVISIFLNGVLSTKKTT